MYVYYPNPVYLPQESSIERIPTAIKRSDGTVVQCDTKTVFFDFFFNPFSNCLHGIGPALLNLKEILLPFQLIVGSRNIDFQLRDNNKLIFLQSQALDENNATDIQVTLRFKTFERNLTIARRTDACRWIFTEKRTRLSISTIQKNNRLVWIKDWILWHSRIYGVKRVILYDNGSDDQDGLLKMLNTVDAEVDIVLVHWPFIFGASPYDSAQAGQLNHCRMLLLTEQSESKGLNYCINLDIDEYLVCPTPHQCQRLVDYLDSKLDSPFVSAVHLKEMQIPNILPEGCSQICARCFDYKYRFRKFGNNPSLNPAFVNHRKPVNPHFGKYIYRVDSNLFNECHSISKLSRKPTIGTITGFYWHKLKKKIKRRVYSFKNWLRYRDLGGVYEQYDSYYAPEAEIFYFNFLGLSDNWKNMASRNEVEFDNTVHIEESLIENLSNLAQLTNSESN